MNEIIKKGITKIGTRYSCTRLDVSPWNRYNRRGVSVEMEADKTRLFDYTVLNIRAMLGMVSAEAILITPTSVDAPCAIALFLHSVGRDALHLEALNTQLSPIVPAPLVKVRDEHTETKDHLSSLNWYEELKLPGCICRYLRASDKETKSLFDDWTDAYFRMLEAAPACDPSEKRRHTEALVRQFILQENDSVKQVFDLLGREEVEKILLTAFFPEKE